MVKDRRSWCATVIGLQRVGHNLMAEQQFLPYKVRRLVKMTNCHLSFWPVTLTDGCPNAPTRPPPNTGYRHPCLPCWWSCLGPGVTVLNGIFAQVSCCLSGHLCGSHISLKSPLRLALPVNDGTLEFICGGTHTVSLSTESCPLSVHQPLWSLPLERGQFLT